MEIIITIKKDGQENSRRFQGYNEDLYNRDWNERVQDLIDDMTDFLKDQA